MTIPRETPFIHVTWLSKILAGLSHCEWATWFQAQNQITKRPDNFDKATYQIAHTSLLRSIQDDLENNGYTISIEFQNNFKLRGKIVNALLSGRPDIIACRSDDNLIIDTKTGEPHASHVAQVMIYMWAVPKAFPKYRNIKFSGLLIYKDWPTRRIAPKELNAEFLSELMSLIRRLAGTDPCRKVPSVSECGFCPITDEDCGERVAKEQSGNGLIIPETDAF